MIKKGVFSSNLECVTHSLENVAGNLENGLFVWASGESNRRAWNKKRLGAFNLAEGGLLMDEARKNMREVKNHLTKPEKTIKKRTWKFWIKD